jgi:hypothetical protein
MLGEWGKFNGYDEPMGAPDYSTLATFRAATADYPRVRKLLAARANAAQSALTKFERQNNL